MTTTNPIHRREFIHRTAVGVAGVALGLNLAKADNPSPSRKKPPVGVQLYSVREACKKDFFGTLAAIAKMGYAGFEFAGYWGRSAAEIKKILDDNGIVACGSHTPYEMVQPDKIAATIEFNKIIGNKFIIVPDMRGKTREEWLAKAKQFNELAEQLKAHGMSIGYHSHWHDFHPVEGEAPWKIFGENTHPEVILQLDTSNACDGGADPLTELKKFPGRTRTIHLKPNGDGAEAIISEDKINWAGVFEWCESQGGTQWYVVEHESSKVPLDTIQRTGTVLKQLGKM